MRVKKGLCLEESLESHRKELTGLGIIIKLVMINKPFDSPNLSASKKVCALKSRGESPERADGFGEYFLFSIKAGTGSVGWEISG